MEGNERAGTGKCKRHRAGPHEDRVWGPGSQLGGECSERELDHWQPGLETSVGT